MSAQKSDTILNEVIIRDNREYIHHSSLMVAKRQQSMLQIYSTSDILLFLPLAIYSSLSQPSKIVKKSDKWIDGKSCCQLLHMNHNKACWLCHNNEFAHYNIYLCAIIYHQNILFGLVNGQTCEFCLIHWLNSLMDMPVKHVLDMNQK